MRGLPSKRPFTRGAIQSPDTITQPSMLLPIDGKLELQFFFQDVAQAGIEPAVP